MGCGGIEGHEQVSYDSNLLLRTVDLSEIDHTKQDAPNVIPNTVQIVTSRTIFRSESNV